MEYVDRSVRKVLYTKFAIGMFENPLTDPAGASSLDNPANRELARIAAIEGTVLLKNDAGQLPLDLSKVRCRSVTSNYSKSNVMIQLKSVAVIGPTANEPIGVRKSHLIYSETLISLNGNIMIIFSLNIL